VTPEHRIRRAGPEDAAALARLAARLFRATYGAHSAPADIDAYVSAHFSAERQRAKIAGGDDRYLLLEVSGEVAGYAHLRRSGVPESIADASAVELARFYLDGSLHGTGLAPSLLAAMLREVAQWGAGRVWLSVWEENHRAIAFYRRQGFEVVGRQPFLLGSEVQHDHVMRRDA
jgi:diamine N-acetyltransferase